MKRKVKMILILFLAVLLLSGGVFGTAKYLKYREQQNVEAILSSNQKTWEAFSKEEDRTLKLETLKKIMKEYNSYKQKKGSSEEGLEDYEKIISKMKNFFLDSYETAIDNYSMDSLETNLKVEEIRLSLNCLKQTHSFIEAEKEAIQEAGDDYINRVDALIEAYVARIEELETASKEALAAVEAYKRTKQNITDEEAYYETYIGFVKAGMRDKFQTVTFADLDITVMAREGEESSLGYFVMDLDSNGVKELLIGKNSEIYGIYTVKDGKMVDVAIGWDRCQYYLCENGAIANESFSGVAVTYYEYYTYKNGAMNLIEMVTYDANVNPEAPWFYCKTERATKADTPLSEEKAKEILDSYQYVEIAFTPLF